MLPLHADVDGKLDDTVYSRKPTALDGAVVRGSETLALPENFQPVTADDSIHIFPKLFIRKVSARRTPTCIRGALHACGQEGCMAMQRSSTCTTGPGGVGAWHGAFAQCHMQ